MIDTHAHYDHIRFDADRDAILTACKNSGIDFIINAAISIESNETMRKNLAKYPWIYYAVGIHPNCVGEWEPEKNHAWRDLILKSIDAERVIAVGETGLDYSRVPSGAEKYQQKMWFRSLIELSRIKHLPLILHIRDAHEEAIEILREYRLPHKGVVHCFHANLETARIYVEEMGLYLGIGGKVTYPEEEQLREAVREIPLERILLETDAPFVRPMDCGGKKKRNTSLNLPLIVKTIAELKGISEEEVITVTNENAKELFCIGNAAVCQAEQEMLCAEGEFSGTRAQQNQRIYLTGDTHCGFQRIAEFCRRMQTTKEDVLVILGDAGVNYYGLLRDRARKEYISKLPISLFCIQGNHEQRPTHFPVYVERQWHGGTVWVEPEFPNILFAKDGEIYELNRKKAIVIGGAYSVDKMRRILQSWGHNPEWWEDEQPSEEIKKYVEQQLDAVDWNVDLVLTHTVPLSYEPVEMFLTGIDQSSVDKSTEEWLERIEKRLQYQAWYAGHYHTEKKVGKLRIMFEDYALL